jgi:hypothetical protein
MRLGSRFTTNLRPNNKAYLKESLGNGGFFFCVSKKIYKNTSETNVRKLQVDQ